MFIHSIHGDNNLIWWNELELDECLDFMKSARSCVNFERQKEAKDKKKLNKRGIFY